MNQKTTITEKGFPFTPQLSTDKILDLKKTPLSPRLVSLFVLLCVLMAAFSVEGAIVNGGFEDSIIDPSSPILESSMASWTISAPASTIVRGQDTGAGGVPWHLAPKAGSIAASFSSDNDAFGPGGSLTQAPPTTDVLKTYNVSMWVANSVQDSANIDNVLSVSWAGSLITLSGSFITEVAGSPKTYMVTPETDWFQITAVVQGTGVPSDLVISARNNNWATLVDEVMFEEVPEPSALVMLGAGAAIMGLRRRRQQRLL